ncbi:MAG: FtsX-like permease family protein, partial [Longimicrobiales bacterium]
PDESALGKQILISDQTEAPYEIVGVVDHVLTWGVTSPDRPPQVYLPLLSHTGEDTPGVHEMAFIVRTAGPPVDLVPTIRNAVSEIDPDVPLALVTTLERMLAEDRAPMAFTMTLIGTASAVALLLSLIGVYGVVSYLVARRSSEIGVRLALGARPDEVAGMILWQGGRVMASGLIAGLLVAIGISRVIESILFQVDPTDPATYAAATITLLAIALLACWIPARRAARLDPVTALRAE